MPPVVKFFLRRELKQARRQSDVERSELIQQVLDDPDLFDLVSAASDEEFQYSQRIKGDAAVSGSGFPDFLKFLFDNRESIFKLIQTLVQLLAFI